MKLRYLVVVLVGLLAVFKTYAAEFVSIGDLKIDKEYAYLDRDNIIHVYLTYEILEKLAQE